VSKDKKKKWIINVSGVKKEDSGYYMWKVNKKKMIRKVGYIKVVVKKKIMEEKRKK
jgi:hypothetical protein